MASSGAPVPVASQAVPSLPMRYTACTPCTASTSHAAWDVDWRHPESGGTRDDGGAEVVEGVSGRAGGEGVEEDAGGLGALANLLARLTDATVAAQQIEYLVERRIVVQIRVEQLKQARICRIT